MEYSEPKTTWMKSLVKLSLLGERTLYVYRASRTRLHEVFGNFHGKFQLQGEGGAKEGGWDTEFDG